MARPIQNLHRTLAAALLGLTISCSTATTAYADQDGSKFRAYFSIPFGGSSTDRDASPRMGLQLLQGVRTRVSDHVASYADATVLDFSFTKDGLASGDVMGIDLVKTYQLVSEPRSLGQNADGSTYLLLALGGAAFGAAILCVTDTICDGPKTPAKEPCNDKYANLASNCVRNAFDAER